MRRNPQTLAEWQTAVDAAAACRDIADCQMYGLLTGPKINVRRCDELLKRGRARGVRPSKPSTELAIEFINALNSEAAK